MTSSQRRGRLGPEAAARQSENRREQARLQFEAACDELRSSEGWQRFAKARALLRGYSLNNTMLILAQRPDATTVASYRRWTELGRQVRRGERAMRIWAPSVRRERDDATGEEIVSARTFVLVPVFDVSQTEGPPLPEPPPLVPLEGHSHAHLLPPLEADAARAGYAVERHAKMPGRAEGFVDHHRRLIALSSALEPNGQVAVLVHELAHVHGARYQDFGRAGAEVVAETASFVALSAAAFDTGRQAVPYVACWADAAPAELTTYAGAVHGIAARLECALGLELDERARVRTRPLDGHREVARQDAAERTHPGARTR